MVGTINEFFIAKPRSSAVGPTEYLRLSTESLTRAGTTADAFRTFRDSDSLARSVVEGLRANWRVSQHIVDFVEDYLSRDCPDQFEWHPNITQNERNELGKYFGEIIPIYKLVNQVDYVGFPTECQFSGVDSFFSSNGSTTWISSKYGHEGSRASIFTNIIPKLSISSEYGAALNGLLEAKEQESNSKAILYNYGINHLISNTISNSTFDILQDIKIHIQTGSELCSESITILNEVSEKCEDAVRAKLPGSLTQYFSRTAAKQLNAEESSLSAMKEVLASKSIIQLNLNVNKWNRGETEFKIKMPSENSDIRIDGNKSAIGDFHARQGTLNYTFR